MNVITDKKLASVHSSIRHGFFGRQGGVSQGVYASLNCGPGSADDSKSVQENRRRVAAHLGIDEPSMLSLWQIHSGDCLITKEPFDCYSQSRPKADAMATDEPSIGLGILTADCGPILLAGTKNNGAPVIGAAHSGWGGSLKGVGEATIDRMIQLGAQRESIVAVIGPCIAPCSYEVSRGFETPFIETNPEDERFFREARKEGHLMFDMPGYIANRLAQHGVKNVIITGVDTLGDEAGYFSFRRSTLRHEKDYGRQISAIVIRP